MESEGAEEDMRNGWREGSDTNTNEAGDRGDSEWIGVEGKADERAQPVGKEDTLGTAETTMATFGLLSGHRRDTRPRVARAGAA